MPTAEVACRELFHYVFTYLYTKYPEQYFLNISYNSYKIICYSTKRTYFVKNLATDDVRNLLTILSECVAMDFSILKKTEDNIYRVIASNSLFAVNWHVSERIGYDMAKLHAKAPGWQKGQIHYKNNVKYFDSIHGPKIWKREGFFIVNTPTLHLPEQKEVKIPLTHQIGIDVGYRLSDLYLRREHQTLLRLPISGLIVFGVRTFTQPLNTLSISDLVEIQKRVMQWDNYTAKYHGRDSWLPVINKSIKTFKP